MSTAFKNWHSLALAAVLYAVNVFLLSIANDMIVKSTQSLEGWVILVVSGYLFIGAIYLVSATLTENNTLSESFRPESTIGVNATPSPKTFHSKIPVDAAPDENRSRTRSVVTGVKVVELYLFNATPSPTGLGTDT